MYQEFKCWIDGWNSEVDPYILSNKRCKKESIFDASDAAEKYAELHHDSSTEYPDETIVLVKDEAGKVFQFRVTWEAVRNYYSEEIT